MIFWWFFDDFLGFVWFSLLKQNLQKSSKNHQKISKNHQKIIVLLEKPWKSKILASFLVVFKQNDDFLMIFWWFPRVLLDFLFWSKTFKNHQNIIKKLSFFIIVFIILKKLSFCYHSVCPLRTPASILRKFLCQQIILANVLKVTLPRFEQRKAAMYIHGLWAHDAKTSRI